jgi:glycerate-2-kinase
VVRPHEAPLTPHAAARSDLTSILHAALEACAPGPLVARWLSRHGASLPGRSRQHVIAVGKAAEGMLDAWLAGGPVARALLIVPHAPRRVLHGVDLVVASHPVPDARSADAAERALALARSTNPGDQLIVLLSGGTSSLLALPAPPCTLDDKIAVSRLLLRAGVGIEAMNTVRRWLSAVKGGRLAAAAQGEVLTLAISDVVDAGDREAATIGSGPTLADRSSPDEARAILERAWPAVDEWPERVRRRLSAPVAELRQEVAQTRPTPFHIIGSRQTAMHAAADRARALGYRVRVHETPVVGEARDAAHALAQILLDDDGHGSVCHVWSGETTVTVRGAGRGGRNQELALAASVRLEGCTRPWLLASLGTDGVDGPTAAAGAIVDPSTAGRARDLRLDVAAALAANDSAPVFEALGDAIVTGPTGTNVGDLQVALAR